MRLTSSDIPVEVFAFTVSSALAELVARSAAALRAAVMAAPEILLTILHDLMYIMCAHLCVQILLEILGAQKSHDHYIGDIILMVACGSIKCSLTLAQLTLHFIS